MVHRPHFPFRVPFAIRPPRYLPQPLLARVDRRRDRLQRRPGRPVRVYSAPGSSTSRAARAARLIPQRPSGFLPTSAISEGVSLEHRTVTIPGAPRTPPAQRDLSPGPSLTLEDLGALEKAISHLTI
ncbi:uncharacterized protein F4812DRAFT_252206 [Daldinia caldariorum]|uniref:uncharacterized protein n=1 Tax=Daldinia caldariorum TaxID=326644 RepID=UPI002007B11C|nr:uncharacterized protein F4812DRAFT_252206 [Daldinia caldariorum]KAI1463349.1 hypothetical protein F4812DRAFT_252206 [Daldinia caldariorum]